MRKLINGLLWLAGLILVVGGILRLVLFKTWTVPDDLDLSSSLAPTLWAGDLVIVTTRGDPGFGDLVRCTDPTNALRYVAGRIVGLPGDTVEIDAGRLVVDGKTYARARACFQDTFFVAHPTSGAAMELSCGVYELGGDWHYAGTAIRAMPGLRAKVDVGEGKVFLLSDNRAMPYDSRIYGTVAMESCKEKIVFRIVGADGFEDSANRFTYIR